MFKSTIIDPALSAQENWERVCKHASLDPNALPSNEGLVERHKNYGRRMYQLAVATEIINKERDDKWFADYHKANYKTEPWFEIDGTEDKPRGAGFSGSDYGRWSAGSGCGSRLASQEWPVTELLQHAFKAFFEEAWIIQE